MTTTNFISSSDFFDRFTTMEKTAIQASGNSTVTSGYTFYTGLGQIDLTNPDLETWMDTVAYVHIINHGRKIVLLKPAIITNTVLPLKAATWKSLGGPVSDHAKLYRNKE